MTTALATVAEIDERQLIEVMQNTLYPGAKTESVYMVLGACKAQALDPMTKPFHIVPMYVDDKQANKKVWRDVVMPGIDLYRTKASRTGEYLGCSEVEFGPDAQTFGVRHPDWARITVKRAVGEHVAEFTVTEYWSENYAEKKDNGKVVGVNSMWTKRPYAQLAKCVEAQALRRAFPEVGAQPTAEEMIGKELDANVIEGEAQVVPNTQPQSTSQENRLAGALGAEVEPVQEVQTTLEPEKNTVVDESGSQKLFEKMINEAETMDDCSALQADLREGGAFYALDADVKRELRKQITRRVNQLKETNNPE